MYPLTNLDENRVNPVAFRLLASEPVNVKRLTAEDEGEVMAFLKATLCGLFIHVEVRKLD